MTATQAAGNGMTFTQLMDIAKDLGAQAGLGRDTQIKMLMQLVEGGYHGAVDIDRNKHGNDTDDSIKLAAEYVKAQSGTTVFDAKAPNQKKLISCFRTCIKLGQWPKGGQGEPLATVNNLMSLRQQLRKTPGQAKKLDDAANTLLRYARQQIKQDTLIDPSELQDFCFRKQHDLLTAEEHIERIRKSLRQLHDGKASNNTALDNSPQVKDCINKLTKRLQEIASQRATPGNRAAFTTDAQVDLTPHSPPTAV